MKPFNPEATCPACGGDDIGSGYHENKWDAACDYYCGHNDREDRSLPHVERTCRRCSYCWHEAPLNGGDAK